MTISLCFNMLRAWLDCCIHMTTTDENFYYHTSSRNGFEFRGCIRLFANAANLSARRSRTFRWDIRPTHPTGQEALPGRGQQPDISLTDSPLEGPIRHQPPGTGDHAPFGHLPSFRRQLHPQNQRGGSFLTFQSCSGNQYKVKIDGRVISLVLTDDLVRSRQDSEGSKDPAPPA